VRILFLLLTLALNSVCIAQDAKVIFYTPTLPAKDAVRVGIVPVGAAPFPGWLWDASNRLAHFQIGRFVVFRFSPGKHVFSGSGSSKVASSNVLPLDLVAGGIYCVRLTAKYVNWVVLPVSSFNGEIAQVPCDKAVKDARNDKPLNQERIEKTALSKLNQLQELPNLPPHPDVILPDH
jgi:hypothetical protein